MDVLGNTCTSSHCEHLQKILVAFDPMLEADMMIPETVTILETCIDCSSRRHVGCSVV